VNKSNAASNYVNGLYNLSWTPTTFFDGGQSFHIGSNQGSMQNLIGNAGEREVNDIDLSVGLEWLGDANLEIIVSVTNNQFINQTPARILNLIGPDVAITYGTYEIGATGTDPDGQDIWYQYDWDDGDISDWIGPVASGIQTFESHAWSMAGNHRYRVKIKDEMDAESTWSPYRQVTIHNRGDANGDYAVNVGDAIFIINTVFKGGPKSDPEDRADSNCDNNINVGDAVFLINNIFKQGDPPHCL
jgi:hypothetical protein